MGGNGQGKTNFLEAIYFQSTLRSFRSARLRDLIQHGSENAEVESGVDSEGVPIRLRVFIDGQVRRLWLGGKAVRSAGEYLGLLRAVAFTPDDLAMVKGAPSLRRRFLDRAAFLFQASHLDDVRDFQTALRARNRLLQDASGRSSDVELESFTETLAACGARVSTNRSRLLQRLESSVASILNRISEGRLEARIRFEPGWRMGEGTDLEGETRSLACQMESKLRRDRKRGSTSIGPQLDDFEVLLSGDSVRRLASQGQQRAVAVALMLSVVEEIVSSGGESPVILLDDVSSELELRRRERLFELVSEFGSQVLVTSTELDLLGALADDASARFQIESGRILPIGG